MSLFSFKKLRLVCLLSILSACDSNSDYTMLFSYPAAGACAIDTPKNNSIHKYNTEIFVRGWAFDKTKNTIPEAITLYLVHKESGEIKTFPGKRGPQRVDVAEAYKNDALIDSGFDLTIDSALPKGKYEIVLLQADRNTGVIACSGDFNKITIE